MNNKRFRLSIELVPSTVWYSSLYNIFSNAGKRDLWNQIKAEIFQKEGRKCWICGDAASRLEAHEIWEYDDKNHIQRLKGIHHLCSMCHKVKHIGLWLHTTDGEKMLEEQSLTGQDIINHFCKVNNCSEEDFEKHEEEGFRVFAERSQHEWKQDFGEYNDIMSKILSYLKNV